jgi:maltose alpha-D-glucosyltransferase/alpha-amylase
MEGVQAPELVTLNIDGVNLEHALEGEEGQRLQRDVLPAFLARQRWFAGKGEAIRIAGITPIGSLPGEPNQLTVVEAQSTGGRTPALPAAACGAVERGRRRGGRA